MEPKKISSRHQAFIDAQIEPKAKLVKGSKAWLNTQQMLKRRTRTCVPNLFSGKERTDESMFNFDDVSHLYQLNMSVPMIKKTFKFQLGLEICEVHNGKAPWPFNFMIVPKTIRRKADAFKQINHEHQSTTVGVGVSSGLTTSLYKTLLESSHDKRKLDAALASLTVEDDAITNIAIYPYIPRYMLERKAPTFTLLLLECLRQYYKPEANHLFSMTKIMKDSELERLANALFFGLLYKDLFSSFFNGSYKEEFSKQNSGSDEWRTSSIVGISHTQQRTLINRFVDDIYKKYLLTANRRDVINKTQQS